MLLEILFPVERLVTVVTLDVLGRRVNHHVRRYVGFLGEGLSTHTAPEVLLTFRTRVDQIVTRHRTDKRHPFLRSGLTESVGGAKTFLAACKRCRRRHRNVMPC